jgi:hypothetical protein
MSILAAILAVLTVVIFLAAAQVAAGGPTKLVKGATVKMDESDKRDALTARLRWISFIFLVLLAADGVAIYTYVNYFNQ